MAARVLLFNAPGSRTTRWAVTDPRRDNAEQPNPAWAEADDHALVQACLRGNPAAFDILVERHQRHVYHLCYRFAGNHEDASDLAQDVFIRAYRALHGFKGQSAVGTWLYRIAVNLCLNRVSTKSPATEPLQAREHVDTRGESADTTLLRSARAAEVRSAIARLPKKQRAAVILRVYHDLPHEQIARMLGSSVGAVKANFFHALGNLRRLLKDLDR
jgi:RNA polymerase sigma-70 factor (ECF subfamily)